MNSPLNHIIQKNSELSEEVDYDALEIKMEDDDPHEEEINHDPSPTVSGLLSVIFIRCLRDAFLS